MRLKVLAPNDPHAAAAAIFGDVARHGVSAHAEAVWAVTGTSSERRQGGGSADTPPKATPPPSRQRSSSSSSSSAAASSAGGSANAKFRTAARVVKATRAFEATAASARDRQHQGPAATKAASSLVAPCGPTTPIPGAAGEADPAAPSGAPPEGGFAPRSGRRSDAYRQPAS